MCMSQTYAKMNLTETQKAKLDALHAQYDKEGCTKESMDKFMKSAQGDPFQGAIRHLEGRVRQDVRHR